LSLRLALGRDSRGLSRRSERFDHPLVGVLALSTSKASACMQQDVGSLGIAGLAGRRQERYRIARSIDQGVDLGAQSAFVVSDGFVATRVSCLPASLL